MGHWITSRAASKLITRARPGVGLMSLPTIGHPPIARRARRRSANLSNSARAASNGFRARPGVGLELDRTGLGLIGRYPRTWPIGQLIGFEFEYCESLAKYELGFLADGLVAREAPPATPPGGWPGHPLAREINSVPKNYRIPNNPIHASRAS
jgi:hypothetical protein